jgi:hypothetical protein
LPPVQQRYIGKRLRIVNDVRAQGQAGYPVVGKILLVTGEALYDEQRAWVWGALVDAIYPESGLPVQVGVPIEHTQPV